MGLSAGDPAPVTRNVAVRFDGGSALATDLTAQGTLVLTPGKPARARLTYRLDHDEIATERDRLEDFLSETIDQRARDGARKLLRVLDEALLGPVSREVEIPNAEKLIEIYGAEARVWETPHAFPIGQVQLSAVLDPFAKLTLAMDVETSVFHAQVPVLEGNVVAYRPPEELEPQRRWQVGEPALFFPEGRRTPIPMVAVRSSARSDTFFTTLAAAEAPPKDGQPVYRLPLTRVGRADATTYATATLAHRAERRRLDLGDPLVDYRTARRCGLLGLIGPMDPSQN